ncbi:MAG: adenylate/guanylate cyclase domain-containing protein [Actinomycetota bacterium]
MNGSETQLLWERFAEKLTEAGVDEQTLARAAAEGFDSVRRMITRYIVFPGERRYTPDETYEKAGVEKETAEALWRAMGFPLVPDDEKAFGDADVEALRLAATLFDRTGMDRAVVIQQARAMGQAAARIAAAHQDVIAEVIPDDDPMQAAEEAMQLSDQALPVLDHLLVYMYRRHLAAASELRLLIEPGEEGGATMSVGFADLSGFTALSQDLDVHALAELIDRFNAAAAGLITDSGGRVIKTIGDEVMFATLDPVAAASLALTLIGEMSGAEGLPALKAGVASGTVVPREGDLFGAPVNLAKRLVTIAKPGSVLVDAATKKALGEDGRFHLSPLTRRYMKGFGHVRSFRVRPAGR